MPNPFRGRLNRNRLTIGKMYLWHDNYLFVPTEEQNNNPGWYYYGTLFVTPDPARATDPTFGHGSKLEHFGVSPRACREVRNA